MSDEKQYTERDLVLAKREGFVEGNGSMVFLDPCARAAIRYPLPKVTRPRVVKDVKLSSRLSFNFRVKKGVLRWESPGQGDWTAFDLWLDDDHPIIGPVWADLLANPTEEVEDDA